METNYSANPSAYLARAKDLLESAEPATLFHAAFELRCCVESRQAIYANALEAYSGTKIRPWKIGETGRRIEKASNAMNIARLAYVFDDFSFVSYHTPVTKDLATFAEGLGGLLHAQPIQRELDERWCTALRGRLVTGYRKAWLACQGDSMVPPLWYPKAGSLHPMLIEKTATNSTLFAKSIATGTKFAVEVTYPDTPPADWVCDL